MVSSSLLIVVTLTSLSALGCYPQLSCALVHSPFLITDEDACGCGCCHSSVQQSVISHINSTISSLLTELKTVPQCGDGLWYRVAYLNMSDSTQQCPSNWREISTPVRTCGRPMTTRASCSGEYFSARALRYSKVCGRAIGYQYGSPGAFNLNERPPISSPNDNYIDGLSVTHGTPRTHIWTYAVGVSDVEFFDHSGTCPCTNPVAITQAVLPPYFVGDNYFCESGNHEGRVDVSEFFENDPVWDGEQCEGECCSNGKSPPWFSVTLPNPTSDDIEVRICGDEGTQNEDTPVQLLEIFIQ